MLPSTLTTQLKHVMEVIMVSVLVAVRVLLQLGVLDMRVIVMEWLEIGLIVIADSMAMDVPTLMKF